MEQIASWKAKRLTASQEIPRILWKPEGSLSHNHRQEPIVCHYPKPDQALPNHFFSQSLIILPFTHKSSKCSLYVKFSHPNRVCRSSSTPTCCVPCPPHSTRCTCQNNIWWSVQITMFGVKPLYSTFRLLNPLNTELNPICQ